MVFVISMQKFPMNVNNNQMCKCTSYIPWNRKAQSVPRKIQFQYVQVFIQVSIIQWELEWKENIIETMKNDNNKTNIFDAHKCVVLINIRVRVRVRVCYPPRSFNEIQKNHRRECVSMREGNWVREFYQWVELTPTISGN